MYFFIVTQQKLSHFDTVCNGCSTNADQDQLGAEIDNESEIPFCKELPTGTTGRSSGTTVSSLTLEKGYYRTSNASVAIVGCYRQESCLGGDDPEKYCASGYGGPCECNKN